MPRRISKEQNKSQNKSQNKKIILRLRLAEHWPQSPRQFSSSSECERKRGSMARTTDAERGNQKIEPSRCTQDQKRREEEREKKKKKREGNSHYFSEQEIQRLADGAGRSQESTLEPTAMPRPIGPEGLGIFGACVTIAVARSEACRATVCATATCRLLSLLAQHADNVVEGLFHIDTVLRGCLDKLTSQLLGQCLAFLC